MNEKVFLPRWTKKFLIASFFVMVSGCRNPAVRQVLETPVMKAQAPRPPVFYALVEEREKRSYASRFHYADDFNAGVGRNKIDSDWQTDGSGGEVRFEAESEDALNSFGASARVSCLIRPGETVKIFSAFKGLDVSQGELLALLLRKEDFHEFPGDMSLGLSDAEGRFRSASLREYLRDGNGRWLEAAVPLHVFQTLDLNRLSRLELALSNHTQDIVQGSFAVDEIAFFGKEDLVFESAKDNLKGSPSQVAFEARRRELLETADDKTFLKLIAGDTWGYFSNLVDLETGLLADHIRVGRATGIGSYISPTNLAFYWLACVSAFDLSLIPEQEAVERIRTSLESLKSLEVWEGGFYYNYYHTRNLHPTHRFISTVDNGWLAAALVVIRQAFPEEFAPEASELLERINFARFYDPSNGQLKLGYDAEKGAISPYHYGLLATEARIASYVAIGKGDLGKEHWARIYRTLPIEWDWQTQAPQGSEALLLGTPVFEGHYTYRGRKFVPSWGGSLFEFLAPTLIVDEQTLAPESLGKNNVTAAELHREYALEEKRYPVWGLAPSAVQNGRNWSYREYGVPQLGAKGYKDDGVIAPYASFLALAVQPEEAVSNLREMLARFEGVYGEYGFYDSLRAVKGSVNTQYLALDQAMSFLAAANYLTDGALRKRFHADPIGHACEALLKEERFSI